MKYIIASDIHGSAKWCRELMARYAREKAERLILLGDILYHGPRNPLPDEYDPPAVVEMLSQIKHNIICVRGNCDAEVDQMVLPFPIMNDYAEVFDSETRIVLSHGHREVPPLSKGDVYITGHTHVPLNENVGYYHLNPGSVSLPKEGSDHSYITYQNGFFYFKNMDGSIFNELYVGK